MTTSHGEIGYTPLCGSCGHNLSGTAMLVCPECGIPCGGLRFATEPTERLQALARALHLMRLARRTLRWMLIGVLVMFVAGLVLAVERGHALAGGLSDTVRAVVDAVAAVGLAAIGLALVSSVGLYIVGVWKLDRATGDDLEFRSVVGRLRIAAVAAVLVTGALGAIPASPSLGLWSIALACLATTSLAVHVWALAHVRFVCMRRIGAWGSGVGLWSNAVLLWSVTGGLCATLAVGGMVVSPLAVLSFLVALVVELGLFTPIETHVAGLLSTRGVPRPTIGARHVPCSARH
jgi:hypothetical protein